MDNIGAATRRPDPNATRPEPLRASASPLQAAGWMKTLVHSDWVGRLIVNRTSEKGSRASTIYFEEMINKYCAALGMRRSVGTSEATAHAAFVLCFHLTNEKILSQLTGPFDGLFDMAGAAQPVMTSIDHHETYITDWAAAQNPAINMAAAAGRAALATAKILDARWKSLVSQTTLTVVTTFMDCLEPAVRIRIDADLAPGWDFFILVRFT